MPEADRSAEVCSERDGEANCTLACNCFQADSLAKFELKVCFHIAEDMPRAERKRQFAAMNRQMKKEGNMHPGLVAKWSAADDTGK